MHLFKHEEFEYKGEFFQVITEPEVDHAVLRESDGYDVTGILNDLLDDGEILRTTIIESKMDFEDYTHDFFINWD